MNRKVSLGVTLALILVAMAVTVSATVMISMRYFSSIVNGVTEQQAMYSFLAEVDRTVRDHYAGTVDEETLREMLARGYTAGCGDPYAAYYSPEEYAVISKTQEGSYTGFGLEVVQNDDQLVVAAVYADSAAETAGIQKQDVLTAVDEEPVSGADLEAVTKRLNNPAKLLLTVDREGTTHSFTLSVSTISLDSVENRMLSDGLTGYLRLRRFADNTPEQLKSALSELEEAGAVQYVLDLRDNAGGSIEAAQEILDYLLPRGSYARLVTNADTKEATVFTSSSAYQLTARLIVLVNEKTEAEAELMAGALQECAGATLVGARTVGHARLQQVFTLSSSNAAVRISVGTMELLQGGSWEGTGLTPDREVALTGSTEFSLRTEAEDDQLQAALTILNGAVDTASATTTTGTAVTATSGTGTDTATTGTATGTVGSTTATTK